MESPRRDIVVIGGSAGALDPLKQIVGDVPADLPAAVVVVLHIGASYPSALATILNRVGGMNAVTPRDRDPVMHGYVYCASPDHHLELTAEGFRLARTPKVNGARPAIDVLFRSAAAYDARVAGVILSGGLDDGSAGLAEVRAAGGVGIVQSPEDALVEAMPRNAIRVAEPEYVLPADQIGEMISRLVRRSEVQEEAGSRIAGGSEMEAVGAKDAPGQVTGLTCPDCHGSIWVESNGHEVTFRCRIGHAYSPESFFEIQSENVENALWAGVRSLEEQASLAGVMAGRSLKQGDQAAHDRFQRRRQVGQANAEALRKLLLERSDA